jgi:TRAP-type C4-dicarboxylate transport system permease small subunit
VTRPGDRNGEGGVFAALQSVADGIAAAATWAAAACLAALLAIVLGEILLGVLSKLSPVFPSSIGFAWEYSAYLMGAAFMLGSGLALRAGMHVRVELLLAMRGRRYARVFETIAAALGSAFAVLLAGSLARFALQSYDFNQRSPESYTPLWIPQSALALGAAVLALQMLVRLAACLVGRSLEDRALGVATLPE